MIHYILNQLYYFAIFNTTFTDCEVFLFIMRSMNTQKPLKNKVSITLDEEVIRRIKELAEADDRNFSQYINLVLKKHIEREGSSNRPED